MLLNNSFPYNSSYKIHLIIGAVLGLTLAFILIALQPFDLKTENINNYGKILLIGFGLVKFINYILAHFIENFFYKKDKNWTLWNEIVFLIITTISGAIFGYLYLDLVIEKQPLSFQRLILFFFYIVLPITPLLIFPKLILRYLFSKKLNEKTEKEPLEINDTTSNVIKLKGQNSKDELILSIEKLLYIKSIDNYVMVFYKDESIKNKILRASLTELINQAPFLVQPHRSYLINPLQAFKITGNSQKATLNLAGLDEQIPIARTSYKRIKEVVY